MRLHRICQEIDLKKLGKPGTYVECIADGLESIKKGDITQISSADYIGPKIKENWYFWRDFKKAFS